MIISIDVGIKNFGIYIVDEDLRPIFLDNLNLTEKNKPRCRNSTYTFEHLAIILDDILIQFPHDISTVLVEKQLKKNFDICRVESHVEAYFKIKHPKCNFVFCNPKNKNIPAKTSYSVRKGNSVILAKKYLENNFPDNEVKNKMLCSRKKDDMADAVCQLLYYLKIE